ncbi:MAG: hypothetical protein E6R03_16110 [Hyphomicrobiaceae bacterium]|nr:MAG: hypothetical protein E6R03_16110 [Hyphomicrobiaceae bacterium]
METIVTDFPHYAENLIAEIPDMVRSRKLLEFAMRAERGNTQPDRERVVLKHHFHRCLGVDPQAFIKGHWFLTSAQSRELLLILLELGVTPPSQLHDKPVAIAPFWSDNHTLSKLYILSLSRGLMQQCEISQSRNSWFGLQSMHPLNNQVVIFPDYQQAMAAEEYYRVCDSTWFPTALDVDASTNLHGLAFDRMRFRARSEEWWIHLPRWSLVEGFEEAEFQTDLQEPTSITELMKSLLASKRGGIEDFLDLCAAMRLSNPVRASLVKLTYSMSDRRVANKLRNVLSRKLLNVDDKGSVYECEDGYHAENGGKTTQVTNFTLHYDSMINFPGLGETSYLGTMQLGTASIPVEISNRKMDNGKQFGDTLLSAQIASGKLTRETPTPTIFKSGDFKRVVEILRNSASSLPVVIGITHLGWNRKHDAYTLPNAVVSASGVQGSVAFRADPDSDHHCYNSKVEIPDSVPSEISHVNPYVAEIISSVVAQCIRVFHGRQVAPWPVKNNVATRDKMLKLFAGIGQVDVFRLTKYVPRNLEMNRGMPCLIQPGNELQAQNLTIAGAYLTEKSATDLSAISDEDISLGAALLPGLLVEISQRLLRKELSHYKEKRSIRPIDAIAAEGSNLIRDTFWSNWPVPGLKWPTLNTLLEEKEREIPRHVQIDRAQDTMVFPQTLWADIRSIDTTDLLIDMGALNLNTELVEQGIKVDRTTMNRVFTDFYGQVPELIAI